MKPPEFCPCQSGQPYAICCQPYHNGQPIPHPLALMRARYSAFALNLPDFLMATTAPDNPGYRHDSRRWRQELRGYCRRTRFHGLTILKVVGGSKPDEGYVTFRARLISGGRDGSFTERSRFVRVDNRWLYHSGVLS